MGNPNIYKHGFKKGQSGNPGGRPKGIAAKAREHGENALQVLVEALEHEDGRTRISAAKEILDRGYGKPLTMTADMTNKMADLDDEFLDAAIESLREMIDGKNTSGTGLKKTTKH